jgi:hypothetical protein
MSDHFIGFESENRRGHGGNIRSRPSALDDPLCFLEKRVPPLRGGLSTGLRSGYTVVRRAATASTTGLHVSSVSFDDASQSLIASK